MAEETKDEAALIEAVEEAKGDAGSAAGDDRNPHGASGGGGAEVVDRLREELDGLAAKLEAEEGRHALELAEVQRREAELRAKVRRLEQDADAQRKAQRLLEATGGNAEAELEEALAKVDLLSAELNKVRAHSHVQSREEKKKKRGRGGGRERNRERENRETHVGASW